ncbi:MAG: c-type cytochrome [Janthinobacterium lividum]
MPSGQIITGLAVIAAFGVLFANNGTQSGRNAIAQADVAHTYPVPAFSQRINQQIAAAAQPVAAPQTVPAVATPTPAPAPAPKPAAPVQAHGIDIKAVAVELPNGDRKFPAGPGADLVANNCVACHSSGMILNQPTLTKATWTAEVNKMVHTYKAPVADEDVEPIIAYLASMPAAK